MHLPVRTTAMLGLLLFSAAPPAAGQPRSAEGKHAKLQRLPASPLLLEAPEGVRGDYDIAETAPQLDFAVFPNQWEGARLWSSWGDALFASDGRFYASIGDHAAPHGTSYVYRIDPRVGSVKLVVDYNSVIGVQEEEKYTPGKIHGNLVDGGDGWIYFLGYRGSVRRTGKETGYRGDWLLRYHMESGEAENLGIAVPYCSVPVLLFHRPSRSLYGLAVPGQTSPNQKDRFFRYDLEEGKLIANGGPEPNMSRALILADDGRAYFSHTPKSSGDGVFVRYDPEENSFTPLAARIPGSGTLRAASRPNSEGVVYCISRDGLLFTFDTKAEKVRERGKAFVSPPLYTAVCKLGPRERYLYYVPGSHGGTSRSGTPVIQYDVETGRRKVIAFLNEYVRKKKGYNLGGTYGIALNEDGSQLFINFNGGHPDDKQPDFGLCSALIVHIPESERAAE